jgi:hypothetical protein
MEYQKAKDIRGTSFGDLMAKKLIGGEGIGESLKSTISNKTKAKMTGIKQSFDPLNMAKFMTGGSSLGPALLGKILGRSKKDINFFAGKTRKGRGGSTLDKLMGEDNEISSILLNIEDLLKKSLDDDELQKEKENNFAEEKESERLRRHKELMEAITGKKYSGKASATKTSEDDKKEEEDTIIAAFGLKDVAKSALKGLGALAAWAVGPIGGVILGAASAGAIGYFLVKALTSESGYEDVNSALSKGLRQAESVGGLAGVKDEEDRIKKLPEYERTMAEIESYEKNYNEGEKLGEMQLAGFAKRGSESARAVEDYKAKRDGRTATPVSQAPQTPTSAATETEESSTPSATPMAGGSSGTGASGSSSTPAAGEASAAMESPNMGSQLQNVQSENLNMKLPESAEDPAIQVNNSVKTSSPSTERKDFLPPVRNLEETFQRMILYSTKVV